MKKKKIMSGVAIGAALAGVMLGGCDMLEPQDLYGPPPDTVPGYELTTEEDLASPEETLYGPPADTDAESGGDLSEEETADEQTQEADFPTVELSSSSDAEVLYGPPPAEG